MSFSAGGGATGDAAKDDPESVADFILHFTLGSKERRNRDVLVSYVQEHGGKIDEETITGMLLLATAMPEYQLC